MESKEIAGIAVALSIVAAVMLVLVLVFLIRHRSCIGEQGSRLSTNPTLSTIWVRKEERNGNAVGFNGNNNKDNGNTNTGFHTSSTSAKESLTLYDVPTNDGHFSLTSNGQFHTIKVSFKLAMSYKLHAIILTIYKVYIYRFDIFPIYKKN